MYMHTMTIITRRQRRRIRTAQRACNLLASACLGAALGLLVCMCIADSAKYAPTLGACLCTACVAGYAGEVLRQCGEL